MLIMCVHVHSRIPSMRWCISMHECVRWTNDFMQKAMKSSIYLEFLVLNWKLELVLRLKKKKFLNFSKTNDVERWKADDIQNSTVNRSSSRSHFALSSCFMFTHIERDICEQTARDRYVCLWFALEQCLTIEYLCLRLTCKMRNDKDSLLLLSRSLSFSLSFSLPLSLFKTSYKLFIINTLTGVENDAGGELEFQ